LFTKSDNKWYLVSFAIYLCGMIDELKSFKIKGSILDKAKEVKFVVGIPMAQFIERAILNEIKKLPKIYKDQLTK